MTSNTEFDELLGGNAPIEVQLNAHVLPSDHCVWKCFPGQTYRFLKAVHEAKAVFLDVRGLEALSSNPAEWEDGQVLDIIAADRWQRELEKEARHVQARGSPDVSAEDRKRLGFLKGLLLDAKRGDLIILPADGYRRDVLIGELLEEPGVVDHIRAKDGENLHTYIGRRVKWLPSKEKREFDEEVIASLHSSTAFHIIKPSVRQEFYEVAYKNFIIGDLYVATFQTDKQHFTTSDNAVVSVWFNALAAAYSATGAEAVSLANKSFSDLGLLRSAEAERGELSIDIASPGSVLLHSAGVFALATMALYPAMEVSAAELHKRPIVVHVHTVGRADASCALQIGKAAEEIVKTLAIKRLQDACKIRARAQVEATLHTAAHLKNSKSGRK